MFGYIKIFENQLRVCDLKAYKGVYCGLCRRIATYSQTARLMLSFDMVFLAMLSEYDQNERYLALGRRKCLKKYSVGRAPVSKTGCREFEPLLPCKME